MEFSTKKRKMVSVKVLSCPTLSIKEIVVRGRSLKLPANYANMYIHDALMQSERFLFIQIFT